MTDDLDAIRARHDVAHSCYGIDPIMGPGYRLFGGRDGVRCDAGILADMLSVERVERAWRSHILADGPEGWPHWKPGSMPGDGPQPIDGCDDLCVAAIIERLRGEG